MLKERTDINRLKSALLYIIDKLGGEADFLSIFKILYAAEKEHLSKYGRTITKDTYIAMRYGPVPSFAYDCFKEVREYKLPSEINKPIFQSIDIHNEFIVKKKEHPDFQFLSKTDIECLDQSIEENRDKTFGQKSDESHDLAWEQAQQDNTMDILKIAEAGGADEEMLKFIQENLEAQNISYVG